MATDALLHAPDDVPAPGLAQGPDPARRAARQRHRARARALRWGLVALALLGVAALVVAALVPDPVPVEVVQARAGPMQVTVDEPGKTRVKDRYVVSAPVAGRMPRLPLHVGDAVAEGAEVVRITPLPPALLDARSRAEMEARLAQALFTQAQARAQAGRAEAALGHARQELARVEQLARGGAAAPAALEAAGFAARAAEGELASARFGVKVADGEVRRVRAALGQAAGTGPTSEAVVVTAPAGGSVLRVLQESAGVVGPGTPLVELGDPAALEVVVDVLSADAVAVRPGAPVSIERWGGAAPLTGHVQRVEPAGFTRVSALGVEEQRVNVVVGLDGPADARQGLGDGYRVEARITVWQADAALAVPTSALFRHGEGWAVFRVDADGRAHLQPVRLGARNAHATQVLEGLAAGARVVLYPGDRVRDGARVRAEGDGTE